jgi:hypothetical protein
MMLQVTPRAIEYAATALQQGHVAKERGFRFVMTRGGSFEVEQDFPGPNDTVFPHEDRVALIFSPEVVQSLQNTMLDLDDSGDGLTLVPYH